MYVTKRLSNSLVRSRQVLKPDGLLLSNISVSSEELSRTAFLQNPGVTWFWLLSSPPYPQNLTDSCSIIVIICQFWGIDMNCIFTKPKSHDSGFWVPVRFSNLTVCCYQLYVSVLRNWHEQHFYKTRVTSYWLLSFRQFLNLTGKWNTFISFTKMLLTELFNQP